MVSNIVQVKMPDGDDWAEKYRPELISELEGNVDKINKIRKWLESWEDGKIPKKRGILLSGPPGIGKTSVALAVAKERNWDLIELNASEQRNAASIRSTASLGSQHISLSNFGSQKESSMKLILLDEVDHLSGGFGEIKDSTINSAIGELGLISEIKGDSGGKAELMKLLETTKQPIIMTCNEPMKLWKGGDWRKNKSRFSRFAENLEFTRVSERDLTRVAKKILNSENIDIHEQGMKKLIESNPGDFRSLIKDLQTLCNGNHHYISLEMVEKLLKISGRDFHNNIFNDLVNVYKSGSAREISNILLNSDKDPDELLAWFNWNNQSIMNNESLRKISHTMVLADSALATKFTNRAFRSWYWGLKLSSIAILAYSKNKNSNQIYIRYPNFLRRSNSSSNIIIDTLAKNFHSSKSSVRVGIWPYLLGICNHEMGGDVNDFALSKYLDISVEGHLYLHGVRKSSKEGKKIIEEYSTNEQSEIEEEVMEEKLEEKELDGQQTSLDQFF